MDMPVFGTFIACGVHSCPSYRFNEKYLKEKNSVNFSLRDVLCNRRVSISDRTISYLLLFITELHRTSFYYNNNCLPQL